MPSSQFESGFKTILGAKLTADATSMTVAAIPTVTAGRLYLNNGAQEEWISFTGRSGTTITGLTRGLSKTAVPATAGTGLTWIAGTVVTLVEMHDQMPSLTQDNPFSGNNAFTGNNTHSGVETFSGAAARVDMSGALLGMSLPNLTTAQRLALTPENGDKVYDSTLGEEYTYLAGAWYANAAGSTQPNASDIVAGKTQLTKAATGNDIGSTGAALVPLLSDIQGQQDNSKQAGEDLVPGNCVYLKAADGKLWKTDADAIESSEFYGICTTTTSANAYPRVTISGLVSGLSGLTAGLTYFVSQTAGALIATTPPTVNIGRVGVATSTTQLNITRKMTAVSQAMTITTVYYAGTSGMVVGYATSSGGGNLTITGYADTVNGTTTTVVLDSNTADTNLSKCFCFPVLKGQYFSVTATSNATAALTSCYFYPM